jgi:hypothetical protein
VIVGGVPRRFRVEYEGASERIGVSLDGLVVGPAPRAATIAVSFAFLAAVSWDQVDEDDGELELASDDPQMPQVLAGLRAAFTLAGVE